MFKNLVYESRSYRSFDESRIITSEELAEFVDCARYAPSSVNKQVLKFKLLNQKEDTEKMTALTGWAGLISSQVKLPPDGHHPSAYIIICHDTEIAPESPALLKDVGIAAQTIMLAAAEAGLGGCMIGCFNAAQVKEAFGLAENIIPELVLAIGKPDETVIVTEAQNGNVAYYRDKNNVHYVPKRPLDEIILK